LVISGAIWLLNIHIYVFKFWIYVFGVLGFWGKIQGKVQELAVQLLLESDNQKKVCNSHMEWTRYPGAQGKPGALHHLGQRRFQIKFLVSCSGISMRNSEVFLARMGHRLQDVPPASVAPGAGSREDRSNAGDLKLCPPDQTALPVLSLQQDKVGRPKGGAVEGKTARRQKNWLFNQGCLSSFLVRVFRGSSHCPQYFFFLWWVSHSRHMGTGWVLGGRWLKCEPRYIG